MRLEWERQLHTHAHRHTHTPLPPGLSPALSKAPSVGRLHPVHGYPGRPAAGLARPARLALALPPPRPPCGFLEGRDPCLPGPSAGQCTQQVLSKCSLG